VNSPSGGKNGLVTNMVLVILGLSTSCSSPVEPQE
jgi:hypothetical protein